jgi:hypothetical protein
VQRREEDNGIRVATRSLSGQLIHYGRFTDHSGGGQVAEPLTNPSRGVSNEGRATANTSATKANRGTEISDAKADQVLRQEPKYASRPGPLQLMLQRLAAAAAANTLLVWDQSLITLIGLYNQAHFEGSAPARSVDSWAGCLKELGNYSSINKLVLLLHSNPGVFLFHPSPTGDYFRDSKKLADAGLEFSNLKEKPKIHTLDLEGCNLGANLDSIVSFGLALGADTVIATNQFHEFALKRFRVAKGEDKELARQFHELNGYLADPHLNIWILMARNEPVDRDFLLEWFVGSLANHKRTLPVDEKDRRENFHPVGGLRPEYIRSKEDLVKLRQVLRSDRTPRRITIELAPFRETGVGPR